jgi:hypothetical protein
MPDLEPPTTCLAARSGAPALAPLVSMRADRYLISTVGAEQLHIHPIPMMVAAERPVSHPESSAN